MKHAHAHWLRPPGPVSRGLQVGLLGGSFNPPHEGHLHASEIALKRLGLDYVWWLVAPQNPLKPAKGMAPLHERFRKAKGFATHPRIVVTDLEDAFGTRYTIDTLAALCRRFPGVRFVWLMGSDNLETFGHWRRWSDIVRRIPIAVVTRPGTILASLHAKAFVRFPGARRANKGIAQARPPAITVVDGPRNTQSSTALRAAAPRQEALVRTIPAC
jgi:nicotinate-nucleotide adenylyltransferase